MVWRGKVGTGKQKLVLEGGREAQARLCLEIAERLLHEAARAAFPVRAIVDVRVAHQDVEGRRARPQVKPHLRLGIWRLPHLQHRTPGVVGNVVEGRERLTGHGPAQTLRHAPRQIVRRYAAAARDAHIVAPAEIGDVG